MGRPKKDPTKSAPAAPQVSSGNPEHDDRNPRYVVVRDGHRVSSQEYSDSNDTKAVQEAAFWKTVETNHSWGAPVKIVQYDNRLHRVFSVA